MEAELGRLRDSDTLLQHDPLSRMSLRPDKGKAYEDLGSDFRGQGRGSKQKKSGTAEDRKRVISRPSTSEDELDCISAGLSSKSVAKSSKAKGALVAEGSLDSNASEVMVDGEKYKYPKNAFDHEVLRSAIARTDFLKSTKFTKKKGSANTKPIEIPDSPEPPSVSNASAIPSQPSRITRSYGLGSTQAASKPFKPPTRAEKSIASTSSSRRSSPTRNTSSTEVGSKSSVPVNRTRAIRELDVAQADEGPLSRELKPAPFPMEKRLREKHDKDKIEPQPFPMNSAPLKETSNASSIGRSKPQKFPLAKDAPVEPDHKRDTSLKPQAFPMVAFQREKGPPTSPPSSSTATDSSDRNPASPTGRGREVHGISPLSSPLRRADAENSQESPPPRRAGKGRNARARALPLSDISDTEPPRPSQKKERKGKSKAQPFPMGAKDLASISRSPYKRGSSESVHSDSDDDARERKRVRGGNDILRELMRSDDMTDSDDEMFTDADPSTLCPWCDEPLPPVPSPYLNKLISSARSRSFSDPRLSNPSGLYAPATVFLNVCHRHRFERHHIPLAQRRGWPMQIEWDRLPERITALKERLQAIVDDIDEDFEPGKERISEDGDEVQQGEPEDDVSLLRTRPRKGSVFWIEIVRGTKGGRAGKSAGVQAQMTNFSKTQPGYYGELGSMMFSQSLYGLFPPGSFPINSTLPLTPADFVQRVLLPETAVSLIMEDMGQSRKAAIATMHESAQYGVAMFPDDHGEGSSAGERIVKKRAEARRKQLEREEGVQGTDDDGGMFSSRPSSRVSIASDAGEEGSRRRNASRRATNRNYAESDDDDIRMITNSDASGAAKSKKARSKRPSKPSGKSSSQAIIDIDALVTPSSSQQGPAVKPRPKPRPRTRTVDAVTTDASEPEVNNKQSKPAYVEIDDLDSDGPPPVSQRYIRFNKVDKPQVSERLHDGSWKIENEATPKPSKVKKTSSRSSSVAAPSGHLPPWAQATSSNKTPRQDESWSYDLRKPVAGSDNSDN